MRNIVPTSLKAGSLLVSLLTLSAAWMAAAPRSAQSEHYRAADHPAAVLAWAQSRCFGGLTLAAGAPRAHSEDVIAVAAAFEAEARYREMDAVCAEALDISTAAIDRSTHPAHTGETALYRAEAHVATR